MSVSAWNGLGSTRGVGGRFHKCDQPDPKLLIRRPVKITLGLKSRYSHGARRKVGRSLKFHDALDESKVQFSCFFSRSSLYWNFGHTMNVGKIKKRGTLCNNNVLR